MMGAFADLWVEAANERLAFIRENEEKLVEAWLAETGLMPSEAVIEVQNYDDGRMVIRVRPAISADPIGSRESLRRIVTRLRSDRDLARRELRALEWLTLRGYPVGIEPGGGRRMAVYREETDDVSPDWRASWSECATALGWEG